MTDFSKHIDPFLVNRREARRILGGVSERWLVAREKDGTIPAIRLGGRVFYNLAMLRKIASASQNWWNGTRSPRPLCCGARVRSETT